MNLKERIRASGPDYSRCLVNLSNSILKRFGAETSADTLAEADAYLAGNYKNVVLLLLDAMGSSILEKHLAEDGLIIIVIGIDRAENEIVSGPELISRGFVYVREAEELMDEARLLLSDTLAQCSPNELRDWTALKGRLRDVLSDHIFQKTKRTPMILPIIMEV